MGLSDKWSSHNVRQAALDNFRVADDQSSRITSSAAQVSARSELGASIEVKRLFV